MRGRTDRPRRFRNSSSRPQDYAAEPSCSSARVSVCAISVAAMRRIDTTAIRQLGIPRLLLMEHAGLAVAQEVRRLCPDPSAVMAFCGTGFNGGDGLAAARHLSAWGYRLHLVLTGLVKRLRDEPAIYAHILRKLGLPFLEVVVPLARSRIVGRMDDCAVLIDALLGIGAQGVVREPIASCIAWMNRSGKPIVAVDIPSGIDADTGHPQGAAICATSTVPQVSQ